MAIGFQRIMRRGQFFVYEHPWVSVHQTRFHMQKRIKRRWIGAPSRTSDYSWHCVILSLIELLCRSSKREQGFLRGARIVISYKTPDPSQHTQTKPQSFTCALYGDAVTMLYLNFIYTQRQLWEETQKKKF